MTAAAPSRRLSAWALPIAFTLLLATGIAAVLLLARRTAAPDSPPEPPPFQRPVPTRPVAAFDVNQAGGGRFTLSDGSRDVLLRPDVVVEVLRPESVGGIREGEWIEAIGVANEVRNLSIRSLVVQSGGQPDAEGARRSPGGFAGHEAARDQNERPLLGGTVARIEGTTLTLQGPAGLVTLTLTPNVPLRRLAPGSAAEIREGDRIAIHQEGSGGPGDARAVLVLPGGAR